MTARSIVSLGDISGLTLHIGSVTISGGIIYGTFSGSITGTITGGQVLGDISGRASGLTGTLAGSQVTGNIAGNAASITGSITGSQVTGNIAGNAATATTASALVTGNTYTVNTITMTIPPIIANPLIWRYYATNGMNNGLNPGPFGTDGQGSFAVFNTDSYPTSYNISWSGGIWSCPRNGVYQINIDVAASSDQDYGGLSLVCGARALYDYCLITRSSIGQSINTVVRLNTGDSVILSATNAYVRIFTGSVGNVWIQEAKICVTMLSSL